jgi:hypothetical protein
LGHPRVENEIGIRFSFLEASNAEGAVTVAVRDLIKTLLFILDINPSLIKVQAAEHTSP